MAAEAKPREMLKLPPPKPSEVQDAVTRVYQKALQVDAGRRPNYIIGDFNGDGSPDLAVADFNYAGPFSFVGVLMNQGDGTFSAPQLVPVNFPAARSVTVGDFNGDGNAATVRRNLAGFVSGIDMRVAANGRAGVAAGYTTSTNAPDGRGPASVETAHIAAYGGLSVGAANLRGGAACAFPTIDPDPQSAFPGVFVRAAAGAEEGLRLAAPLPWASSL